MVKKVKCVRCHGRKKIFKFGAGYTFEDNGGVKVDCPLCMGEGMIEPLTCEEEAIKEIYSPVIEMTEKMTDDQFEKIKSAASEILNIPKKEKKK